MCAAKACEPHTWDFCKEYAADPERAFLDNRWFYKTDNVNRLHQRYQEWCRDQGKEGPQYLQEAARWEAMEDGRFCTALEPNFFPYNVSSDIQHWVLWYHPDTASGTTDLDVYLAWKHVCFFLPTLSRTDVVIWQNAPGGRSVKMMAHAHVCIRSRSAGVNKTLLERKLEWQRDCTWAKEAASFDTSKL